jgi:hypothetical protein
VSDATFACPDLTTFTRLDELGLEVIGQRLEQTAGVPPGTGDDADDAAQPGPAHSHEQKKTTWGTAVADALLPRLPEDLPDLDRRLQAAALSGAALASAQATWIDSDGQHHLVDVAISSVP